MPFLSVKDAYVRWRQLARLQVAVIALAVLTAAFGFGWVVVPCFLAWVLLGRSGSRYEALFWNQALALHSSKREGEPEIYEFMSRRHREQHARLAAERHLRKDERA